MENLGFRKESEFRPESIAIATTTFYGNWYPGLESGVVSSVDKVRGDLALEAISEAVLKGFDVVVVDGGSSKNFLKELEKRGVIVSNQQGKGMGASRRQAFKEASIVPGIDVICWVEPEKTSIIRDCLFDAICPIIYGDADIIIPARTEESYGSYPKYQADIEKKSNILWNDIVRKAGFIPEDQKNFDIWFGPKFFRNTPEIVNLFLSKYEIQRGSETIHNLTDPDMYANTMSLPIVAALAKGKKVVGLEVQYLHPVRQTVFETNSDEFNKKRERQRRDMIVSTIEFVRFLKKNKKSKIEPS